MTLNPGTGIIIVSLFALIFVLLGVHRLFTKSSTSSLYKFRHWIYIGTTLLGLIVIFAFLPIESSAKNSVFTLLGLIVTGVIAISSTTFASNAMAGVMLHIINNFKPGDFIEVENYFGRVTETGILHTEIQTKNRELTTLPNLFLISHVVTVTPKDKAIVDATLSLGYDVSHHRVEEVLKSAADKIGLTDAFVQVTDLNDFSVGYRVAGFLNDPKLLLSVRSNLRKQIIDSLHGAGIEIVSPDFINQRRYPEDKTFISKTTRFEEKGNQKAVQSKVFDKAEKAENIESYKEQLKTVEEQIKTAKENSADKKEIAALQAKKDHFANLIDTLTQRIEKQK